MPSPRSSRDIDAVKNRAKEAARLTAEQEAARKKEKAAEKKAKKEAKDAKKKKGVTKRTSTKEQQKEERKREKKERGSSKGSFGLPAIGKGVKVVFLMVVILAIACGVLYSPVKQWYSAMRHEQHEQAIYDAYQERNEALEKKNKELETDEGVKAQAQEELGWVEKGEEAVVIDNAGDEQEGALPDKVDESKIHAPESWYYDILDNIFSVSE